MGYAKAFLLACFYLITGSLVYALWRGNFSREGSEMLASPWGRTTVLDAYIGLALFSGWVLYREKSPVKAFLWVFGVLALGHPVTTLYALIALYESGQDWRRFWLGGRA